MRNVCTYAKSFLLEYLSIENVIPFNDFLKRFITF